MIMVNCTDLFFVGFGVGVIVTVLVMAFAMWLGKRGNHDLP